MYNNKVFDSHPFARCKSKKDLYKILKYSWILCKIEKIFFSGECGKLIHMKTLPGVSNDDAEDDGKSVSSTDSDVTHKYNELEQHYYHKLLSMNKDHLGFLQHDPRFHKETLCNVCGRVFGKTRHLLQHITDKVKSGSDDEENHTELLHELVLAFTSNYQHHFTFLHLFFIFIQ